MKGKQQDKQDALILLDEVTALCPDDESLTRKCLDGIRWLSSTLSTVICSNVYALMCVVICVCSDVCSCMYVCTNVLYIVLVNDVHIHIYILAKHALYLAVGDVDAALVTKQAIRELQSTTSTNTTSTTGITTSTLYTGANSSNSISSSKRVSTNGTASYTNHHTSNYTSTSSGVSNISGRNAGMYGGDSAADPQLSSQSSNVTTSNVTTTTASTVVPQLHNNKDTISQLNYLIQLTGSSSSCKERSGIQPLRDIAAESSTCQSTAKGTKHHKHSHKHSHKHHKHHKHTHGSRSRK